jgi:outer membrane protein
MTTNFTWRARHALLYLPFTVCAVIATGCAHTPTTWTPDSVQPPPLAATSIASPTPLNEQAVKLQVPEGVDEAGAALPVTRDGAILTGLLGNRFIEVARFGPEIDATYFDEARASFDPRILARVSTGRERALDTSYEQSANTDSNTGGSETSSVQRLLTQVQNLNRNINALGKGDRISTITNTGSVEVEQWLPTGTLLFLTGGAQEADNDGDGVEKAWTVGVSQPLLRGANMRANLAGLRQARNIAAQSEHQFRQNVMDVVRQIELTYWELTLAREVLGIRRFGVGLAEQQVSREEDLKAVGKAVRGDVMTANAERAAREADLADALAVWESQTIELIRLMHPSDTPRWDLSLEPQDPAQVVELETNAGESEELALLFRPELAQARLTIANLELDVLQTGNERLPRLDVVGAYGDGRSSNTSTGVIVGGFNDTESYSIGLEFETAIPNRAENARHRRAKLENRRGEGALVQLEENIAAEVRRAIIEVTRQWQRLAATAEAVLSREEAVRVVQGRREVGMATNLDVLQVERDFIESQVDDATARVRYIQALTQLYAAEGTLLERRGISMEAVNEHKETLGTPTYE